MLKSWALILAIVYTFFLTILSLISIKKIPNLGSSFDDKIYHLGAYALFTLVWYNYFVKTSSGFKVLFSAGIALAYGIIVEVLQGVFTSYRTLDAADILANGFGVLFAVILIIIYRKIKLK